MRQLSTILFLLLIPFTVTAQFGNSLYTDGAHDYIVIPDNDSLDLTDNFTIECWIQAKSISNATIFRKGWCEGGDNAYQLRIKNGAVRWHWNKKGNCNYENIYSTADSIIKIGICTHISVIHSSSEVKIYIDNELVEGTLIQGNYSTIHSSGAQLDIGAYRNIDNTHGIYYNGTTDELRFWNYKLTPEEIIDYSYSPLRGDESGLVAYFNMEKDTGRGSSLTITNKAIASGTIVGQAEGYSNTTPYFVNSCIISTDINNPNKPNTNLKLYPNPTTGKFTVDTKDFKRLEIYNYCGVLIKSSQNKNVDISNEKQGFYIVKIISSNKIETKILILE